MGSPGFVIYTLREILILFFGPLVSHDLDKKIEPKMKERFVIRWLPADDGRKGDTECVSDFVGLF